MLFGKDNGRNFDYILLSSLRMWYISCNRSFLATFLCFTKFWASFYIVLSNTTGLFYCFNNGNSKITKSKEIVNDVSSLSILYSNVLQFFVLRYFPNKIAISFAKYLETEEDFLPNRINSLSGQNLFICFLSLKWWWTMDLECNCK